MTLNPVRLLRCFALLLCLGTFSLALGLRAQDTPTDVQFKVPVQLKGLTSHWVIPPNPKAPEKGLADSFGIDTNAQIWMSFGSQYLTEPLKQITFGTSGVFSDVCYMGTGAAFFGTSHGVAYATQSTKVFAHTKDLFPIMELVPILRFKLDNVRLFDATRTGFYLSGVNPTTKKCEIYYVLPDPKASKIHQVLVTDFVPSAIAGNGTLTFLAQNQGILMYENGKLSLLPTGIAGNVQSLAFSEKSGLFYATETSVGFIYGKKYAVDFLKAKNCQVRVQGKSLYVLVPDYTAILAVTPLTVFAKN